MISHFNTQHPPKKETPLNSENPIKVEADMEENNASGSSSGSGSQQNSMKRKYPFNTPPTSSYCRNQGMGEVLAKCAVKNGFPVAGILHCDPLKAHLRTLGYEMPKSAKAVWKSILDFYQEKFEEQKLQIKKKLQRGVRFSITLDEWTDLRRLRYLMLNLHDSEKTFNLGLVPIPSGRCTADVLFYLVATKLNEVQLNIETDLVASTMGGAAVIGRFGTLTEVIAQFCINQAMHLSVVDVLYAKSNESVQQNDIEGEKMLLIFLLHTFLFFFVVVIIKKATTVTVMEAAKLRDWIIMKKRMMKIIMSLLREITENL